MIFRKRQKIYIFCLFCYVHFENVCYNSVVMGKIYPLPAVMKKYQTVTVVISWLHSTPPNGMQCIKKRRDYR